MESPAVEIKKDDISSTNINQGKPILQEQEAKICHIANILIFILEPIRMQSRRREWCSYM